MHFVTKNETVLTEIIKANIFSKNIIRDFKISFKLSLWNYVKFNYKELPLINLKARTLS